MRRYDVEEAAPSNRTTGRLLVAAQLVLIAALFAPWSARGFATPALVLVACGVALGIWALVANPPGNFSVFPEPRANARPIGEGPYRFVRHPMYLAVLVAGFGAVLGWRTPWHAAALVMLALVLHVKARIEERAMAARFPQYRDYAARTARIVPFVY